MIQIMLRQFPTIAELVHIIHIVIAINRKAI